jgi:putative restriction endonuclease
MLEHQVFPVELSSQQISNNLIEIAQRQFPPPGRRQVPFNVVETLLCYGLFYIIDPHHFGGANIATVPPVVKTLAAFFRRTSSSLLSKMLNLDGSRKHSAREEPLLFASLAAAPTLYRQLYQHIFTVARSLSIEEDLLPDFLNALSDNQQEAELVGQDDLPQQSGVLLAEAADTMNALDQIFELGDLLTEKLVEQKIRLAQHRFALAVLQNCDYACVFCGFAPRSLSKQNGLLRASHIKPWAASNDRERVDVRNGLAACPMHDAAFDRGYLTVNRGLRIYQSDVLQQSIRSDPGVSLFFENVLRPVLLLPQQAVKPGNQYLSYHQKYIFKG